MACCADGDAEQHQLSLAFSVFRLSCDSNLFWRIIHSVVSPSTCNFWHCVAYGVLPYVSSMHFVVSDNHTRILVTIFSQCLMTSVGKFETPFAYLKIHFLLLFRKYLCMGTLWAVNTYLIMVQRYQKVQLIYVMPCCKENSFSNLKLMWPI